MYKIDFKCEILLKTITNNQNNNKFKRVNKKIIDN